jgi:predicted O-methyltransferase YrrM
MSTRTIDLDDRLYDYMLRISLKEPPVLGKLRKETAHHVAGGMQISPEQGQLMAFLVETLGVSRALEVGVFTGYSSTRVALALPPGGRLVALDVSEEFTNVARRYWREAGVEDRIELRLGDARDSLRALLTEGAGSSFDFAFVDADKENYVEYFERCLELVRPGGVILFDNVLWSGRVADPDVRDSSTMGLRALNEALKDDPRVTLALVPIGDGVTLVRRKP